MSRGPGFVQQRMLEELEREHASVLELCERMYAARPITAAQYAGATRAMRSLVKRGLAIELKGLYSCRWLDGPPAYRKHFALPAVSVATSSNRTLQHLESA